MRTKPMKKAIILVLLLPVFSSEVAKPVCLHNLDNVIHVWSSGTLKLEALMCEKKCVWVSCGERCHTFLFCMFVFVSMCTGVCGCYALQYACLLKWTGCGYCTIVLILISQAQTLLPSWKDYNCVNVCVCAPAVIRERLCHATYPQQFWVKLKL